MEYLRQTFATSNCGPVHVVANGAARRARGLARIVRALGGAGVAATVHRPESAVATLRLAKDLALLGTEATVVVAGGDGTVNVVLNGLMSRAGPVSDNLPSLAIWPLGTANVTAREIGVAELDAAGLAALLTHGRRQPITIGRLGDIWFLQMVSVGFDAMVVEATDPRLKGAFGRGAYLAGAFTALPSYRATPLSVTIDGKNYSATQVIVANGRFYGGKYVVAPDADLAAPTFEVRLLTGGGLRLTATALGLAAGRLVRSAPVMRGQNVCISAAEFGAVAVQADGDVLARTPVEISAVTGRIRLIRPG